MQHILGPLLVLAGFGVYMLLSTFAARYSRTPWESLAVSALGPLVAVVQWARDPILATALTAAVTVALFAALMWFYFSFSVYGAREDRPRVGDRFEDFQLLSHDGTAFAYAAADRKRRLLIFYRGSW